MSLPEIPKRAVDEMLLREGAALDEDGTQERDYFAWLLEAAWPNLYAAALHDFANRMDRALETVGAGDDPVRAYRFVVACARSLAEDQGGLPT